MTLQNNNNNNNGSSSEIWSLSNEYVEKLMSKKIEQMCFISDVSFKF